MTTQSHAKSHEAPAAITVKWKANLARLDHMADRLNSQIDDYDELPEDHPDIIRHCASDQHNRQNLPALRAGAAALRYHQNGPELLSQLVAAVRAKQAARTAETRMEAAGLLEEAMSHAAPFVDQLESEG